MEAWGSSRLRLVLIWDIFPLWASDRLKLLFSLSWSSGCSWLAGPPNPSSTSSSSSVTCGKVQLTGGGWWFFMTLPCRDPPSVGMTMPRFSCLKISTDSTVGKVEGMRGGWKFSCCREIDRRCFLIASSSSRRYVVVSKLGERHSTFKWNQAWTCPNAQMRHDTLTKDIAFLTYASTLSRLSSLSRAIPLPLRELLYRDGLPRESYARPPETVDLLSRQRACSCQHRKIDSLVCIHTLIRLLD